MSTTSTNFSFVIATTSDVVNVVTQIANNFSSVDSIVGAEHTGTGSHKAGIRLTSPILVNPTVTGTVSGPAMVSAQTGSFNTITATGGLITVSSVTAAGVQIGTYSMPATIGATGNVLSVVTGNAVWASNTPGTGAAEDLSNLSSVAINTNLGTFAASKVTIAELIATSGTVSGLATMSATTGTFSANLTVVGTLAAGVVNCTGGAITAGGISIGTYSFPATVGSTGQVLTVTTGNAIWASASLDKPATVFEWHGSPGITAASGNGFMEFAAPLASSIGAITTRSGGRTVVVTYGHTASAGLPDFSTVFYKHPNANTLGFTFKDVQVSGFYGGTMYLQGTGTGFAVVFVGTASATASVVVGATAWTSYQTLALTVDVSGLTNATTHALKICLGAVDATGDPQYGVMAVGDIVGYVIS